MDDQGWDSKPNNLSIIYDYTRELLNKSNDSWVEQNNKLGVLAGISGFFLKFAFDVKVDAVRLAISFIVLCIVFVCGTGYWSRPSGSTIKPDTLLENFYYESEEKCKLQIISNWDFSINSMSRVLDFKALCVNVASLLLFACFLLFAIACLYVQPLP
jgi:hypothetical protein